MWSTGMFELFSSVLIRVHPWYCLEGGCLAIRGHIVNTSVNGKLDRITAYV